MFYHALIGKGGDTPAEDLKPVLLWENPSPTNAFAAQTISLDLTDYAGVLIECHQTDTESYGTRVYIKKTDSSANGITGMGFLNNGGTSGLARDVSVSDSGVTFTTGTNLHDTICVPNKIYGVKAYVVEPQIGELLWTNPSPSTAFAGQKISVNLAKSKGVIVEFMLSNNTQKISSRQLLYKNDTMFGVGYVAGENATSRNITAIEDDGVTFSNGKSVSSDDNGVLIPYKIYAIN